MVKQCLMRKLVRDKIKPKKASVGHVERQRR